MLAIIYSKRFVGGQYLIIFIEKRFIGVILVLHIQVIFLLVYY